MKISDDVLAVDMEKSLVFPVEEYARRLATTRRAMAEAGVETLVVMGPEDMFYLTGYRSYGYMAWQALVVRMSGNPLMVSRDLEKRMYLNNSWASEFAGYEDHDDPVTFFIGVLRDLGVGRGPVGLPLSSLYISWQDIERLGREFPGMETRDTAMLVPVLRRIKSDLEIAAVRRAADATRAGTLAAIEACEVGATENTVAAACLDGMIGAGSEHSSLGPLIATGFRAPFGHAAWERKPIEAGDLIFIECGGAIHRYHAAAMRTVSMGPLNDKRRRLEEASRDGLSSAIAAIKPGVTSADVDTASRAGVAPHGLSDYYNHRSGYSIGIGFSTWIEKMSLRPNDDTVLEEGMVLHVIPALSDDDTMLAISETVLVTATGAEPLVNLDRKAWVK